jgi:hypothetical protein
MVAVAKQDALSARRSMIDDLLRELYDHAKPVGGPRDVHLVETHISWVLVGPEVYKIKKPVSFPFLDFASFEERERACRNEVRINRRLAPRVYLGVVPIRRRPDGRFTFEAGGPVVEWAVRMRRLDEDRRADHLLTAGRLDGRTVDRLACLIASFHASSPTGPRILAMGSPAVVGEHVRENFAALHQLAEGLVAPDALSEIERWQLGFLRVHPERFEARMKAGAIRDGHGDLRLEHVFVHDEDFEIIDGIEFDDRYRWGDVAADVAFLAMDLARLGRTDLAERFVASYASASGDFDIYEVLDFYESYRACIRAKIVAASAPAEARRCLLLALSLRQRNIVPPMLVCVSGGVAEVLAEHMSAPVVGVEGARFSDAEVLRRASVVLASGRPVIIDGVFDTARARALAERHRVPFRCIEASSADATTLARVLGDVGAWPQGLTG